MTPGSGRLLTAMVLGVALYGAAIFYTGMSEMKDSLGSFEWWSFGGALALATTNYLIRFLRWEYYLEALEVRGVKRGDSLLVFLSGFVLTVTPGKVGEVLKSLVLQQTHSIPVARTAPIVVAERLADVVAVVALILCGSTSFDGGLHWAAAGATAVTLALVAILWERPSEAALVWAAGRPRLSRFEPKAREAIASLRALSSPRRLLWPLLLSIMAWACEGVGLWLLVKGLGYSAPLLLCVFFYATASLAGALIPVPGGLGVVEAMLRTQLVHLGGIPAAAATSSMILVRFATLWWAVLVGLVALGLLRRRYPALRGAV